MSQRKIRVLYLLASNVMGGVETCVLELAKEMPKVGIETAIAFLRRVPKMETVFSKDLSVPIFFHDTIPLSYLIAKLGFDIIHFHRPAHALDCAKYLKYAGWDGVTIVTCQGDAISDAKHLSQLPFVPDYVTTISEYLLQHVKPVLRKDVPSCVIYSGIDFNHFYPDPSILPPERPIIGWVGHTTGVVKNLAGLMILANIMPEEYEFWVASSTEHPYAEDLKGWTRGRVKFLNRQTYFDMPHFYRKIAASGGCLVITSHTEGLCLAAIEAIACGCPVVAPKRGALPEVISDGVGGFLYHHEKALDEVPYFIEQLRNPQLRQEVVRRGLEHVKKKFSLEHMVTGYLFVYNEALKRKAQKRITFQYKLKNCMRKIIAFSIPIGRQLIKRLR
jgi:glycosyltransferase involved in cell wall biosynthesis